ncbi:MAG: lipoprotein-releasing ABC transporter permease subunit [Robiginitomaculum sp.]
MATNGKSAPAFGRFERTIAARYLGARKSQGGVGLIAAISFACITLAIAAMIIVMSIMNGFREELISSLLGASGHIHMQSYEDNPSAQTIISVSDWVNESPQVEVAFPILNQQAFVAANGRGTGAMVRGIAPADLQKLTFVTEKVKYGDLTQFGVGDYGGDSIAIGLQMAHTLGAAVGDKVTLISPKPKQTAFGSSLQRKSYTVGGIFSLGYFEADSLHIYMPLEQALLFFDQGDAASEIEVRLHDAEAVKPFGRYLRMQGPENFAVRDWQDQSAEMAGALRVEQISMRMILGIVVIIAIFPVVAAMIMLVKNKSKDIAILRTIGTTRGSILRIFFMAGFVIGALGTLAGLILGVAFCLGIGGIQSFVEIFTGPLFPPEIYQLSDGIPAVIKTKEVAMVAFWGLLISSVATYFPAKGASKLDPVEALRFE